MYLSIPVIVLLAGMGMFFVMDKKVTGIVTTLVALIMMGAVNIPHLSPLVHKVQSFF